MCQSCSCAAARLFRVTSHVPGLFRSVEVHGRDGPHRDCVTGVVTGNLEPILTRQQSGSSYRPSLHFHHNRENQGSVWFWEIRTEPMRLSCGSEPTS